MSQTAEKSPESPFAESSPDNLGKALCVVLMLGSLLATGVAWMEIESIVGSGPLLAAAGFMVVARAYWVRSGDLLWYGLSAPLTTALGAMIISLGRLDPEDAHAPIGALLTVYTIVCGMWAMSLAATLTKRAAADHQRLQFSLRSLLIVITVLCVLFAMARWVPHIDEFMGFFAYGAGVLVVSLGVALWFPRGKDREE